MIKINSDLHTHTIASHGKGTMEANVQVALQRGLRRIGITDHGPSHLFGVGIKDPQVLLAQKKEARALAKHWPQIEILVGVEANIISPDGELDVPRPILEQLDLILVGLHPRVMPGSARAAYDLVLKNWLARFPSFQSRAMETNTKALILALERYRVDFVVHPGLHLRIDTLALAKAAEKRGVALELSSGHGASPGYLRRVLETGVKLVVSSDAHRPEDVGNFKKAIALVEEFQIPPGRILNADK